MNQLFRDCMRPYNVTFSAGMVVAHGLEPLNEVRDWAREAESTAKNDGGRDALCISVNPRSGAPITVYGEVGKNCAVYCRRSTSLAKPIPRGFGYEIRDLVERIARLD